MRIIIEPWLVHLLRALGFAIQAVLIVLLMWIVIAVAFIVGP